MSRLIHDLTRYMRSAGYTAYLFSPLGLRSSANRSFIVNSIPRHFGYQPVKPDLQKISVDNICQPGPIELIEIQPQNGNVSVLELAVLAKLIARFKPKRILEIGTFDGRTSLNMAANAPDATIFTLDLPRSEMDAAHLPIENADKTYIDKNESGLRFANSKYGQRIVQLYGDSATFDFAPYKGNIDFIFVDGSHSYEYVMSDSTNAFRMLTSHGLVIWHDYMEWPGVTKALNHINNQGQQLYWIENTSLAIHLPTR